MQDAPPTAEDQSQPGSKAPVEIVVPYQDRPLTRPSAVRVRRLRRHLMEALDDLRAARRPDRLIQYPTPPPPVAIAPLLRAACSACRGDCCLGGGEHAWVDARTLARVRRDRPDLDAREVVNAYIAQVAPLSFAGSCLYHGAAGCTLSAAFRAELCASFYCNGLTAFLRRAAERDIGQVVIRTEPPNRRADHTAVSKPAPR